MHGQARRSDETPENKAHPQMARGASLTGRRPQDRCLKKGTKLYTYCMPDNVDDLYHSLGPLCSGSSLDSNNESWCFASCWLSGGVRIVS